MYESLLNRIDAISASLGLIRESAKTKKGVNPWGYTNGKGVAVKEERELEVLEKPEFSRRSSSFESDVTIMEKKAVGAFCKIHRL